MRTCGFSLFPPAFPMIRLHPFESKLARRIERIDGKLKAWAEVLDAAGWCVALRILNEEVWLGERAQKEWVERGRELPDTWEVLLSYLEEIPEERMWVREEGIRIWGAKESGTNPSLSAGHLTRREKEVMDWLREGKTAAEISIILGCSVRTVEKHVDNLYRKLGVNDRASLILKGGGEA